MIIAAKAEVERWPFLRDCGFYLLAVSTLCYVISDGEVEFVEANALLGLYCIYVFLVIFGDKVFAAGAGRAGGRFGSMLRCCCLFKALYGAVCGQLCTQAIVVTQFVKLRLTTTAARGREGGWRCRNIPTKRAVSEDTVFSVGR